MKELLHIQINMQQPVRKDYRIMLSDAGSGMF